MSTLTKQDREALLYLTQKSLKVIRKYDTHMEPYDEVDNLDHHLLLVEALLENN